MRARSFRHVLVLDLALAIFELAWLGLGSRSAWRRLRGPLSDHGAQARDHLAGDIVLKPSNVILMPNNVARSRTFLADD